MNDLALALFRLDPAQLLGLTAAGSLALYLGRRQTIIAFLAAVAASAGILGLVGSGITHDGLAANAPWILGAIAIFATPLITITLRTATRTPA